MNKNVVKLVETVKSESIISKDQENRYLITRSWNPELPKAMVIMLYPTKYNDALQTDLSTCLATNAVIKLGFGTIMVANLFSKCKENSNTLKSCTDKVNDEIIVETAKEADKIIMATGRNDSNKVIKERKKEVLELLSSYKNKIYEISDKSGKLTGFHPLSPKIRNHWELVKLVKQ